MVLNLDTIRWVSGHSGARIVATIQTIWGKRFLELLTWQPSIQDDYEAKRISIPVDELGPLVELLERNKITDGRNKETEHGN